MKIEFLDQYHRRHGLGLRERLLHISRVMQLYQKFAVLLNLRDQIPGLAKISEWVFGLTSQRPLPKWRSDGFSWTGDSVSGSGTNGDVAPLVDTFNGCFESENAYAALDVLNASGYRVHIPQPVNGDRALCCGRTFE